jgi:phospholipid transport system substrate-binding protein
MLLYARIGVIAALAAVVSAVPCAWAGAPTDQIRGAFNEAGRVLEDPSTDGKLAERLAAIRRLVNQTFDFRKAAELALGPAWEARTPAEQDTFARLFGTLLERAFILGIASRAGIGGAVNVNYLDETADGDWVTVRTTVVSRDGGVTPYTYWMIKLNDRWAVCDVVIDGFSVVANYRSQFTRILQTASFSDLLQRMQAKVSEASEIWTASLEGSQRPPSATPPAGTATSLAAAASQTLRLGPADKPESGATKTTVQPTPEIKPTTAPPTPVVAAARAAIAAPVKAAVAAVKSYWVQVGAFATVEAAKRLAIQLHDWRLPVQTGALIAPENGPVAVPLARVRVGPFADRAEAEVMLRSLRDRGFTPFIAQH